MKKRFYAYNHFRINYTLYKEQDKICAEVDIEIGDIGVERIKFYGDTYKKAEINLREWFKQQTEDIHKILKKGYEIQPCYEDVLYSIREKNIGYHITSIKNRKSILKNGLIPNKEMDLEVYNASVILDELNNHNSDISKANSVYLHPQLSNWIGEEQDEELGYRNMDVYAVIIDDLSKCIMGSLGLSGFCMMYDIELEKNIKRAKHYGKLYWNNCCTIDEYREYSKRIKRIDKSWRIDEILVNSYIPPKYIKLIGTFNSEGEFIETQCFKKFVKKEFKDTYKEILKYYI
ncbi:DUF4433 domain-containing protein [Clostridium sp. AWRP]|uniref:DUF4433 domain-containing protein n=1 Tax=Clostridium sp. AWRP TaxID=2212991 RepID=UPI000FDA29F3|nr:DUF4433 domain-containing protein [Clostridium sp. AWRP]AZV56442.1 DUF4433 domain-containing protein [Clostridium sp. AWRP]